MSAEAWPTEAAATAAVEAAARTAYERDIAARREAFPPSTVFPEWDDLEVVEKLRIREAVLPVAWAMLQALPDPRYMAWAEGNIAGQQGLDSTDNPYPSGL